MCGRFYIDDETSEEIKNIIAQAEESLNTINKPNNVKIKGEIYPTESVSIITGDNDKINFYSNITKWGFPNITKKGVIINARSESILEKPMFSESVLERRCIIPAKGFYEWDSSKNKLFFHRSDNKTMFFAGIYKSFTHIPCFVIITTKANESMIGIHDRMPLIIEKNNLKQWLFDDNSTKAILNQIPLPLEKEAEFLQQSFFFD